MVKYLKKKALPVLLIILFTLLLIFPTTALAGVGQ